MTRQVVGALAALLGALAIGCGGGGETKTVTVPAEEPTPGADGTEATATPTGTPGPAEAVAQSAGTADGDRVTFVLTELRRSGPTVVLNGRLETGEGNAQVASAFDDGIDQEVEGELREGVDVFDGVAMVDAEGRKKYLVARDEAGRCVCTNQLNSQFATPEAPVQLTATLTAPPTTVTEVDLLIPHFETLRAVPITE